MELKLPKKVEMILNRINLNGHEAYVVGGCVRDALLDKTPNDWDICTSATPEEIKEIFKDKRVIETGIRHGTVTLLIDDEKFEVTTYRTDVSYDDNRHPSKVKFVKKLKDDLKRRDFTINAMAYNTKKGLVDYFGGRKDLQKKTIKCVGNPDIRFMEDALRIMRAARFADTLGFDINKKTFKSMFKKDYLLKRISIERINSEFVKSLKSRTSVTMLKLVQVIVPELTDQRILTATNQMKYYDLSIDCKLALIFDFNAEMTKEILKRLKFNNATTNNVYSILKTNRIVSDMLEIAEPKYIARCLIRCGGNLAKDMVLYHICKCTDIKIIEELEKILICIDEEWLSSCHIGDLNIDGNDLIKIGFEGKEVGEILEYLLNEVIFDNLENKHSELVEYAKKYLSTIDFLTP